MYEIHFNKKFKSAFKKVSTSGRFRQNEFEEIIKLLENNSPLPAKYRDHNLTGNMSAYRECHISGNMLLVYYIDRINKIVILVDVGNHPNLFG